MTAGAHTHDYLPAGQRGSERATRWVIALTAFTMVAEVVAGSMFHSMALLADGWHMASHASALGIAAFAYAYARRHRDDPRYAFGTAKVGVLGGHSSAVVLGVIALLIAWESLGRFVQPLPIRFDEAILVAALGLAVNLFSAWLLRDRHDHDTGGGAHAHDHNLRGAYLHVLADALTSLFAIVALLTGKYFGWTWMDPAMGLVGAAIIARWSWGLLRDSARVLLDGDVGDAERERVRRAIEEGSADRVEDLHVWRIGPHALAAIIAVAAREPRPPELYRARARSALDLAHVTVEVNVR